MVIVLKFIKIGFLAVMLTFIFSTTSYCKTSDSVNIKTVLDKQSSYEYYIACPVNITLKENISDIGTFRTNFIVKVEGEIPSKYRLNVNVGCTNSKVKSSSLKTESGQEKSGWAAPDVRDTSYVKLGQELVSQVVYESMTDKLDPNSKITISVNIGGNS